MWGSLNPVLSDVATHDALVGPKLKGNRVESVAPFGHTNKVAVATMTGSNATPSRLNSSLPKRVANLPVGVSRPFLH